MSSCVMPGYSAEFIKGAVQNLDAHSVRKTMNGNDVLIPVWKTDNYAPIYYSPSNINHFENYIAGYPQSLWVESAADRSSIPSNATNIYKEFSEAIAYWLWQISPYVYSYMEEVGDEPITISFEFDNLEKFTKVENHLEKAPDLLSEFQYQISDFNISIIIPSEVIGYLYDSNNEGERVLLKILLTSVRDLLNANGATKNLDSQNIDKIIEEVAPLGYKKKVFFFDTSNNLLLDPTKLVRSRYVQNYNENQVLDSIVLELGNRCPSIGEITEKEQKTKLTRDIVMRVLLPKLKRVINQYSSTKLLEKLIPLNEALIQKREEVKLKTPTRIACFVSVEKHTTDLISLLSKLNRTSLSVRCLIEHLAAEPNHGTKAVSTSAIDELISIMDQIIHWGMLGDQINYDLFNIKMGVLSSERIGTEKQNKVFDPYYNAKTQEQITDAIEVFSQAFPNSNNETGGQVPESLDRSFADEFGVSFTKICEFINDLGLIAYNQQKPHASLLKSKLYKQINNFDHTFSTNEIDSILQYLTIFNRGTIETIPQGFENFDISPWRFSRRLSLMRKPIIEVPNSENPENPYFYWGFRQVLLARLYLGEQCLTNRLKVIEGGYVQKTLGKLVQRRGAKLVKDVIQKFGESNLIIEAEMPIRPQSELTHHCDIGDIDVFIIDKSDGIIYSLECKSIAPSRNIKEMVEEVLKLFGSGSDKGWIQKHVERHEWIENNKHQLSAKFGIDLSSYKVQSFIVTQEDMLTPYLKDRKSDLPFVSLYNIKEFGLTALNW